MGNAVAECPVVEPGIIQTRFVSGILRPVFNGRCWCVSLYEERELDGRPQRVVVDRFALMDEDYRRAVSVAALPLAAKLVVAS